MGRVPFGHAGLAERLERLEPAPRAAAENVFRSRGGTVTAERILERWLASRQHRANLLGDYRRSGVGVAASSDGTALVTQIYVR